MLLSSLEVPSGNQLTYHWQVIIAEIELNLTQYFPFQFLIHAVVLLIGAVVFGLHWRRHPRAFFLLLFFRLLSLLFRAPPLCDESCQIARVLFLE